MAKKQSGLGKGLSALMLENSVDEMVATNTLPLNEIMPNKEQPRKTFDEGAFAGACRQYYSARCASTASCQTACDRRISACCRRKTLESVTNGRA